MEKSKLAHRREEMEREPHSPSMREMRDIISGGSCTAYIIFSSISQTGDSFLVSIPMEHTHLHANRGGKVLLPKSLFSCIASTSGGGIPQAWETEASAFPSLYQLKPGETKHSFS